MNPTSNDPATSGFKLARAPIVEAVVDIDCDLPPGRALPELEQGARECYGDRYPKAQTRLLQEHEIKQRGSEPPELSVRRGIEAFLFLQEDGKQLVQVRAQGYSFNRLAPYSSLDDYLPEIERTWRLFVGITSPAQVRCVRLRYINRMSLPMPEGRIDLDEYLATGPRVPDQERLMLAGFVHQQTLQETRTGHLANIVLTTEPPQSGTLPVILDIGAESPGAVETDWAVILLKIQSLRDLKNRIFRNSLTAKCLDLFQ
jgi:uncharacterized protein (TIGR04255 family)